MGVFVLWGDDSPATASVAVLGLALQMIGGGFWNMRFRQMSCTAGMLQVKEEARQRQRQQQQQRRQQQRRQQQQSRRTGYFGAIGELPDAAFVTDPDLRSAIILLLIQQLLMSPHIKQAVVNAKLMSQLASKGYCCDPDPLLSAAAAAVRGSTDSLAPEAVAASSAIDHSGPRSCASAALVGPVLLQLGPVLLDILDRFEPSAEPDVQPEDIDALTACYSSLVAVGALADGFAKTGHMAAALQQQPALRSLELAVRASAGNFGDSLGPDLPSFALKPLRQLYDDPSPAVAKLLPNTYRPPAAAAAAAAGYSGLSYSSSSGEGPRPDGLPLFSLLLSGLKLYTGVVGKAPPQQQPAGALELLIYCADALDLLLKMSELNEGPAGATAVRHRWLVLAGRLLASTNHALQDLLANVRSINASIGHMPTDPRFLAHCLHPSCARCEGAGEEASVKNGKCSSCKAAHYCCAGCQKQHWSVQHKVLCKKLKAQPESAAACLEAA
ncbi:hypothetical protein OEZ85_002634 [Tetradesmus obliquus]|uniref:phytol kinase n=1 Tax=Tetradesmus obliquus TaxID=3088 RepID=A0ABY8TY76_TETOB|nr:hypothetical protein OEZ85_002634 [Tetradesmus obliquus]